LSCLRQQKAGDQKAAQDEEASHGKLSVMEQTVQWGKSAGQGIEWTKVAGQKQSNEDCAPTIKRRQASGGNSA
jgi:hypothetical protein